MEVALAVLRQQQAREVHRVDDERRMQQVLSRRKRSQGWNCVVVSQLRLVQKLETAEKIALCLVAACRRTAEESQIETRAGREDGPVHKSRMQ